ncbi:dTDP-4-dehydrorhamnose 3,5-epimerase family protein [Agromyces sp. NPDC055520]
MKIRETAVPDSYVVTPHVHSDDRGRFVEYYRFDALADAVGHPLALRQGNISVSRRGSLRGIHFADLPLGQAKYITVLRGAVLDLVFDLRVGSPTFGVADVISLDDADHRAVYIAEGLGHAFLALEDETVVSYLVSDVYRPEAEHGISPLDPMLALDLPLSGNELLISEKDAAAPTLEQARAGGILPTWEAAQALYAALDSETRQ